MERTALISICILSSSIPFQGYIFFSDSILQPGKRLATELYSNLCQTYSIKPKLPIKKTLREPGASFKIPFFTPAMPVKARAKPNRQIKKI